MYKYWVWARINPAQTVNTYVWASNDYQAKQIAEAQFGIGNVLNWSRVSDEQS